MNGTPRLPTIEETMIRWPAPWRRKTRQRGARGVVGAEVVDVEELSHLVGGDGVDRAGNAEPGVANHDVQPPNRSTVRRTSSSMSCSLVTSATIGIACPPAVVDFATRRRRADRPPCANRERRAVARETHSRRTADSGRGSCYRDDMGGCHPLQDSIGVPPRHRDLRFRCRSVTRVSGLLRLLAKQPSRARRPFAAGSSPATAIVGLGGDDRSGFVEFPARATRGRTRRT